MQNQVSVIGMYEVCFVVIVQCKYTRFFTFIGSGILRRLNEISTEFDRFNLYVHIYICKIEFLHIQWMLQFKLLISIRFE